MPPPLDTNIIIREITRDDPGLSARAHTFLRHVASGAKAVLLTEGVIVECVQVLSSKVLYNLPRADIARDLGVILRLRGVRITNKRRYLRALALYVASPALDFVDALLVAYAELQSPSTVVSFDEDFDHVASVTRECP